jgi:O-methyltransferase
VTTTAGKDGRYGAIERYEHSFAHSIREVRNRLEEVGFPPERTHLVAGHLDEEITATHLPEQVCLAFLDSNLYEPTRIALDLLHDHLPTGATVVVDGYGYFIAGPRPRWTASASATAASTN